VTDVREHFPRTPRTIVFEALDAGREADLSADLMRLYAQPLEIYYSATSFRRLGDPTDIVSGFFSSRFGQPGWLADWRRRYEIDRIPLRRWLVNGLNFYLLEEFRRLQRDRRQEFLGSEPAALGVLNPADRSFEHEAARAIVGEALDRTRNACEREGQQMHFEVFMRHTVGNTPYEAFASELGLTTSQCAGMARTVSSKFRRALTELLVREGADPTNLEAEIGMLREALGR
jgi:hypothetical protein